MAADLSKRILWIVLYGIGLGSATGLLYLVGPFVSIGGWSPFSSYIGQSIGVLVITAVAGSFFSFQWLNYRKKAKALTAAVAGGGAAPGDKPVDTDEVVLKDKLKDALATLKTASGGRKDYLYDLPWYLLIGPPGSGKTTALVNSGLKFPLSRGATPTAVAGVGGTRYCDWWFTEDAVLIDTAGRYTTQDSDSKADKASWLSFLNLLKKSRPRQPINGVMVAISLENIMTLNEAELAAHSDAIRLRLLELHQQLKVDFPVYALFTKCDLVAGFTEYFGYLGDNGRKQVWGSTFQTNDKTRNLVSEVPVEFDHLLERLSEEQFDRLQDEPAPNTRVSLFGFATQMMRLKQPLYDFLNQIFEPTRYHANATLRGFYFTSGTQQGTPIDQLIGSLSKSFGAEEVRASQYSGLGKSFFLHDLILKVVIGEAAWVSTDWKAVRRAMILKATAFASIALVSIGLSMAWLLSYRHNRTLIDETEAAAVAYAAAAGPYATETVIADRNFPNILPLLDALRALPAGYEERSKWTPLVATFGLSQRERLQSAAENIYRIGLERMFRSRLLYRLEQQLTANVNNQSFVYETLKIYLMLGGLRPGGRLEPQDQALIKDWMRRDLLSVWPAVQNLEPAKRFEDHLTAMFELGNAEPLLTAHNEPLIQLDGNLVRQAQLTLARSSIAQRAYELLKSQSRIAAPDWVAARKGGSGVADVFADADGRGLENVRIPGFFTYDGFHAGFLDRLSGIEERIRKEQWVLGPDQQASVGSTQLNDEILRLYEEEFKAIWTNALKRLRLKQLPQDRRALSALAGTISPLKYLIESIRDETALTKERRSKPPADPSPTPPAQRPMIAMEGGMPGAKVEAWFRGFQEATEGGGRVSTVDEIVAILNDIFVNLDGATTPVGMDRANKALPELVSRLRAISGRLPDPFSGLMRDAAEGFSEIDINFRAAVIAAALKEKVVTQCQQIVTGRYPFVKASINEIPLRDFARLFGSGGIMDSFFEEHIKRFADTTRTEWTWKPGAPKLQLDTLRQFQTAMWIKDAYLRGTSQPSLRLSFRPSKVAAGLSVKFESGGSTVVSPTQAVPSSPGIPGTLQRQPLSQQNSTQAPIVWPGSSPGTTITVQPENGLPTTSGRDGNWSLFRVLEMGISRRVNGDKSIVGYYMGGEHFQYEISTDSQPSNPLDLAMLRRFKCPTEI